MKQILIYSIALILIVCNETFAQNVKVKVAPFTSVTTSVKEGQLEAGPEFIFKKDSVDIPGGGRSSIEGGNSFTIRPTFRIPLTNKDNSVVQIDRFARTWRSILALQYTVYQNRDNGSTQTHSLGGQFEYGSAQFKYYPTGKKSDVIKNSETSFGGEIKYIGFFTKGKLGTKQLSPQVRLRYSYDWKAGKEVGVLNPPNANGVSLTTDLIVEAPTVQPTFSPALAFQFYPGKGSFSYAPAVYYDMTGTRGQKNPFDSLDRLRLEFWAFYYPLVEGSSNLKVGLSPFMSVRTKGTDDFNQIEYGGMITIRFNSTFLQFF